ncbi:MAG: hypothetical protein HRU22_09055 [Gammaproteobacteria bacterium]|nr:hypothetical protein [Gammaproteobacteria bacterium]
MGEEGVAPGDLVIPNATALPLAGTDPLNILMGLTQITEGAMVNESGVLKAVVKFTRGHHSSLLRPNMTDDATPTAVEIEVTQEMQKQLATFMASSGTYIPVKDSDIIAKP